VLGEMGLPAYLTSVSIGGSDSLEGQKPGFWKDESIKTRDMKAKGDKEEHTTRKVY